jgi:twitching motility protein PilT
MYVLIEGSARVQITSATTGEWVELSVLSPPTAFGEMGLLLGEPRSATVVALSAGAVFCIERNVFTVLCDKVTGFSLAVARGLARRLADATGTVPLPVAPDGAPQADVQDLLPREFVERHRVMPLRQSGNRLEVGFVDHPSSMVISAIRKFVSGMEVVAARLPVATYNEMLRARPAVTAKPPPKAASQVRAAPGATALDTLLHRMIAEGASDLHLSAGQSPRWRVDGEILPVPGLGALGENEVLEMWSPVMEARSIEAFRAEHDVDFAYAIAGLARFRVNLFVDRHGVGAVVRQIPAKILTFTQLGLPPVVRSFTEQPKGLVLVTGPTGSGKSTTLAAMIDAINHSRRCHILTLEDPIEFVHTSDKALINQREVGGHTRTFSRALKAALREDPDIVLVGELRDLETVSLALETANTGHLVFGTLHTATAASTVDRIIDLFPPEQHDQVRAVLAETLRGVVAQTLCRKVGGGRIAALEILVGSFAVSNMIREGKTHQLATSMATGRKEGNQLLNEELAKLVTGGSVELSEAMARAVDKADLARRCGAGAPK